MSSIVTTLTSGIQTVAALLPLFGIEQCEERVSSALTKGYLDAAATPMSLLGSLGLAKAGIKTLLAALSFSIHKREFVGVVALSNRGVSSRGINLSLIMVDEKRKGSYLLESRLDEMHEELFFNKTKINHVSPNTNQWNFLTIVSAALLCSFGMIPYIYLNTMAESNLPPLSRWIFPAFRVTGGFLTATFIQFIIQRRITILTNQWLDRQRGGPNQDAEKTIANARPDKSERVAPTPTDLVTFFLLIPLFLGILASAVGYVGCFTVIQSAQKPTGPLSWFGLEVGLVLFRWFLWGHNPSWDDPPPLELVLNLDPDPPLPTCNQYDECIEADKVLPLTRASQFLNSITSFAGLIERFDHPDLTLYFTFTRKGVDNAGSLRSESPRTPCDRVLYITVLDDKERTTRIYKREGTTDCFYESAVPVFDLQHGLLETKLGKKIRVEERNDPIIYDDRDIRSRLISLHQSIMDHIHFTIGKPEDFRTREAILTKWTMVVDPDRVSCREIYRQHWTTAIRSARERELEGRDVSYERDKSYLTQGWIEGKRRSLDRTRGEWIEKYMDWVIESTRKRFDDEKEITRRIPAHEEKVNGKKMTTSDDKGMKSSVVDMDLLSEEWLFSEERWCMEKLLVSEVAAWEQELWTAVKDFAGSLSNRVLKEQVRKEWRGNYWKRINVNIEAMKARMEVSKAKKISNRLENEWRKAEEEIRDHWQKLVENTKHSFSLVDLPYNLKSVTEIIEEHSSVNETQRDRLLRHHDEMQCRLHRELEDIKFRLTEDGLENCDKFWSYSSIVPLKHSRTKWLGLKIDSDAENLEVYSRALIENKNAIFIFFEFTMKPSAQQNNWIENVIKTRGMRSIYVYVWRESSQSFDAESPIRNGGPPIVIHPAGCPKISESQSLLCLDNNSTIKISFKGPSSGNLTLSLTHRSRVSGTTLTMKVAQTLDTLELPIPSESSLTLDDITLYPRPSGWPSFEPNEENHMTIRVNSRLCDYFIQDIKLLDEKGTPLL